VYKYLLLMDFHSRERKRNVSMTAQGRTLAIKDKLHFRYLHYHTLAEGSDPFSRVGSTE
jgi:hypothetical protein